ncbi:unnamed protein product [Xylocopa violacea]|uniref:Secreted protein n=1 Tax=Xylocopa violacea TaxID=135666 RepID=A0ABP1PI08_XYLVO
MFLCLLFYFLCTIVQFSRASSTFVLFLPPPPSIFSSFSLSSSPVRFSSPWRKFRERPEASAIVRPFLQKQIITANEGSQRKPPLKVTPPTRTHFSRPFGCPRFRILFFIFLRETCATRSNDKREVDACYSIFTADFTVSPAASGSACAPSEESLEPRDSSSVPSLLRP